MRAVIPSPVGDYQLMTSTYAFLTIEAVIVFKCPAGLSLTACAEVYVVQRLAAMQDYCKDWAEQMIVSVVLVCSESLAPHIMHSTLMHACSMQP